MSERIDLATCDESEFPEDAIKCDLGFAAEDDAWMDESI